jgi:nucleoid-associated protein YgaU
VKIFLSYPSARKDAAASICYELQAEGHDVFFDKEDLRPAQTYHDRIRTAMEESDLLIFLITPESVSKGKYTRTELKLASRKWPNPTGHVLPVMLEPTPFDDLPPYLRAVTILSSDGNLAGEIVMEVADLSRLLPGVAREGKAPEVDAPSFSYRPLEIRFGERRDGGYPVSLTDSPAGTFPPELCALDPPTLEKVLWSSAGRIDGAMRRARVELGETSEDLLPSADDVRKVGEQLYRSLFLSGHRRGFEQSLRAVDAQRGEGLRFLINTTDAPDLARLPWEFLYDPERDDFLFSDRMKPVIRWLDVDQPPPLLSVQPPLRLLMAVASPQDRPELNVSEEIAHLDAALSDLVHEGLVETVRLEHATLEKLDAALLRNKPHVLHFIGHGDFSGDEGLVVLEAEMPAGGADPISGRRLSVLLRNHLGTLRFVFLNSCLGAAVSVKNPFGGVAQSLIQRGIPAVIAMQFPIPDRAAIELARHFYRYLAAGLPVDTALTSVRAFLYAKGYQVEWGAPALYMRTPSGRLFDVTAAAAAAPAVVATLPAAAQTAPRPAIVPPMPGELVAPAPVRSGPAARTSPMSARPRALWWSLLLVLAIGVSAMATFWMQSSQTVPPRAAATAPPTAEAASSAVVRLLEDGNVGAALVRLNEMMQGDPNLAALDDYPALRTELLNALAMAAREALMAGDMAAAAAAVKTLLEIEPTHAQGTVLRDELTNASQQAPDAGAEPRIHDVARGDTLWAIAGSRYGDPTLWPRIYEANRDNIANPDLIYPNQRLRIPFVAVDGSAPGSPTTHRVERGESLWRIAADVYGAPLQWARIYEANRTRIEDPNLIFPDQVLTIP